MEAGRAASRKLGKQFLAHGIRFDTILTSPLVRAVQTADEFVEIIGESDGDRHEIAELVPGKKARKLDGRLLEYEDELIAIIGH